MWYDFNKCCTYWFSGTWEKCCCVHDNCYDKANIRRLFCDREFRLCVARSGIIGRLLASVMYKAVRLFGKSHYNIKQRKINGEF